MTEEEIKKNLKEASGVQEGDNKKITKQDFNKFLEDHKKELGFRTTSIQHKSKTKVKTEIDISIKARMNRHSYSFPQSFFNDCFFISFDLNINPKFLDLDIESTAKYWADLQERVQKIKEALEIKHGELGPGEYLE